MKELRLEINPEVHSVFENYPDYVREKVLNIRRIIIETAQETSGVEILEETLKWGEPSYLAKNGSTVRVDWKTKSPDQYAVYFKCTSKLVPTFKKVYGNLFTFEGNRAIVFKMDEVIPVMELKNCIRTALEYHRRKNKPYLDM